MRKLMLIFCMIFFTTAAYCTEQEMPFVIKKHDSGDGIYAIQIISKSNDLQIELIDVNRGNKLLFANSVVNPLFNLRTGIFRLDNGSSIFEFEPIMQNGQIYVKATGTADENSKDYELISLDDFWLQHGEQATLSLKFGKKDAYVLLEDFIEVTVYTKNHGSWTSSWE